MVGVDAALPAPVFILPFAVTAAAGVSELREGTSKLELPEVAPVEEAGRGLEEREERGELPFDFAGVVGIDAVGADSMVGAMVG